MFQFVYKTLVNDSIHRKKLQGEEKKRKTHELHFYTSIYMESTSKKGKKDQNAHTTRQINHKKGNSD